MGTGTAALALALVLLAAPALALDPGPAGPPAPAAPGWEATGSPAATADDPGGTATAAGVITGLAYSYLEGGGFQVATLFKNTGTGSLSGLSGTVVFSDSGGRELAVEPLVPEGEELPPGGEMILVAKWEAGPPTGAAFLAARVVAGDGTLLAEQREPLEAGREETASTTAPGIPGFTALPALAALAAGLRRARTDTSPS